MLLHLIRHGIAVDRADPECPTDSQRPLTDRGRRRTRRAAEGLQRLGVSPEWVISSPWVRAVQTAEIVVETLGLSEDDLLCDEDLLPMADPGAILRKLESFEADELMLVGHAPHLDLVLEELCRGALLASLTKAGGACVELDPRRALRGTLRWLLPSKGLRRLAPR